MGMMKQRVSTIFAKACKTPFSMFPRGAIRVIISADKFHAMGAWKGACFRKEDEPWQNQEKTAKEEN